MKIPTSVDRCSDTPQEAPCEERTGMRTASGYERVDLDSPPGSSAGVRPLTIESIGPFRMRRPLTFEVENLDDGVVLSCDEADIYASGSNLSEAKEDIVHQLQFAWREYALCDDDELDGVAKRYKRWLLDNVVKKPID